MGKMKEVALQEQERRNYSPDYREPSNLQQALKLIQSNLKAPKGQFNSFGRYNYRSAEDILEALKPLLKQNSLTLTITENTIELGGYLILESTLTLMISYPFVLSLNRVTC